MRRNPIMRKRIIALSLCLFVLVGVLASCAGSIPSTSEYKGQQITMYLAETVYDLDPARAYKNESTRSIVGLLFDTLFVLDKDGKIQPSLAESYSYEEKDGEYYMYITMAATNWSDNTPISADDVVFAWKRLLNPNYSFEAAALLFDIEGAREYNENEGSKDDIKITADKRRLTIQFNRDIDKDQFLLNLTSLALAPLREDVAGGAKGEDWAKKPGTMICSGPFKLARISFSENANQTYSDINYDKEATNSNGNKVYIEATTPKDFKEQVVNSFIIERNAYYYRNSEKDENLDASVAPYRIIVDCAMSDKDIKEAYEDGTIMYVGDIPMSLRNEYKNEAVVKDSLSTNTIYFNHNAEINGEKIFANAKVRQALSMAIDRKAIADALVFAEAADGLVPTGVFNTNSKSELFRNKATTEYKYLNTDVAAAKKLLAEAGISDASKYTITLTYAAYDEVHTFIAKEVEKAWESLGFNVELNKRGTVANNDYYKYTDSVPPDICDDLYAEDLTNGNFEAIILDMVAISADPFSVLAPFAKQFSGQVMDMSDPQNYQMTPHVTGYDSEEYNALIEKIYTEKTVSKRATDLHKAEDILMEDMPVIPVVFNKTAYLANDDLKLNNTTLWWENGTNYYNAVSLRWCSVDNYDDYLDTCSDFLESKFSEYQRNPLSYFGGESYKNLSWDAFKEESSNYAYLWKVYEKESNLK